MKKILIIIAIIIIIILSVFSYIKFSNNNNSSLNSDLKNKESGQINNENNVANNNIVTNKDISNSNSSTNKNTSLIINPSTKEKSIGGGGGGAGGGESSATGASGSEGRVVETPQNQNINQPIINQNDTTDNSTVENNNITIDEQTNITTEIPSQNQTNQDETSLNTPPDCYIDGKDSNELTIFSSATCHDSTGSYTNLCASPINQDATNTFIKTFVCINNRCSPKYYSCPVMGQTIYQDTNYRCVSDHCTI